MLEILQTDEFTKWMKRLRDADARARINVRIRRISLTGNFGDTKPVGDGVYELRINYGPGYRVYYSQHRSEVVLLLRGQVLAAEGHRQGQKTQCGIRRIEDDHEDGYEMGCLRILGDRRGHGGLPERRARGCRHLRGCRRHIKL